MMGDINRNHELMRRQMGPVTADGLPDTAGD